MENILDHIASYLKKDPLEVRQLNLITPGVPRLLASPHEQTPIKDVILPLLFEKANFVQRKAEVEEFNRVSGESFFLCGNDIVYSLCLHCLCSKSTLW